MLKYKSKGKIVDLKAKIPPLFMQMMLVSLGLNYNDEMIICADGIGALRAVDALCELVESNFESDKVRGTTLEKTQFTMLGMTGSGKTCYLLGMYTKMLGGMKGFSLTTDDDTDVDLRRRYNRMSDASLGQDRFPAGTDQTDVFDFTLEHALSPIMSFRWIDYPGGMLEEKTSGDTEQYNRLEEYIRNSSSLFICVDGALLQGDDDNEDKAELLQEKCSRLINPFLSRYLKSNNFLPPTAIVVTKSDLCMEDTSNDDLREIIEESFSPLFVNGEDSNRFIAVIPVSLGKSIFENNYKGKLAPKQLQLPIFMGVWFALASYMTDIINEINTKKSYRSSVESQRDDEKDSFFLWRDDAKVRRLDNLAKEISQELSQKQERYNKALRDGDKLLEDLEKKVKLIYFNGMTYESFKEAANKYLGTRMNTISSVIGLFVGASIVKSIW